MTRAAPRLPDHVRRLPATGAALLRAADVDTRLLGLMVALAIIWIGFNIVSGGDFLTARNLWNLSVQSASIGIMATGMVLVIVSRNIDLSVGSMLGFIGYTMAMVQTDWIPGPSASGSSSRYTWIVTVVHRPRRSARIIGALQGFVIAYGCDPVVHRHARRPAGLARADLPVRPGPDPRAARHDVPPARRRADRLARRVAELDRRHHRVRRRSSSASSLRGAAAVVTASRCGRCGPRSPIGVVAVRRRPRRRLGGEQLSVAGGAGRPVRRARTASPSRRAASSSRPASPSRSSS